MNVLVIQPGFPAEIPYFVRGLAEAGAKVLGLGDQPETMLPDVARESLHAYLRVTDLWDDQGVVQALRQWRLPVKLDRVECLWEPAMMLAASLRTAFSLEGMDQDRTLLFRDKELMKQALDRAGLRCPRHRRARNKAGCIEASKEIGFPVVIKPISGAGSADTYRVENEAELGRVLGRLGGVRETSIEEFIEGREYTFDTICANGEILYYNIAWYRPNVLIARSEEWISPQTVTLRDLSSPHLQKGKELGEAVLRTLGFRTGFTHMEWFLTAKGEAVFGEIAARPPGGRSVELMNYGCDIDVFRGWGEAIVHGAWHRKIERKYNAAVIFKRASGQGRIRRIDGLAQIYAKYGDHIVCNNLSKIGDPRRNWKQTLVSDGYLIVRHEDLETTLRMADEVGERLRLYAGP